MKSLPASGVHHKVTQYVDGLDAVQYFDLIQQHQLEGIVMKEQKK